MPDPNQGKSNRPTEPPKTAPAQSHAPAPAPAPSPPDPQVKAPIAPGLIQVPTTVVPTVASNASGATIHLGQATFALTPAQIDHLAMALTRHRDLISKQKSRLGPAWSKLGQYENPCAIGGESSEGTDPTVV
jgi:hypothetical protein